MQAALEAEGGLVANEAQQQVNARRAVFLQIVNGQDVPAGLGAAERGRPGHGIVDQELLVGVDDEHPVGGGQIQAGVAGG
ncbi:hypothetical protein D3C72_1679350 [compost metagenome]